MKSSLEEIIEELAEKTQFSGVVEVNAGHISFRKAWGFRDRVKQLPNDLSTRFCIASATKGFTALGIVRLIEEGKLAMDYSASSILGETFPGFHPDISIKQLLAHTSGIGDYFDEDENNVCVDDFYLSVPVKDLESPFDYLPLLTKQSQKFLPGEKVSYSNSGYVVLAMIIEIISNKSFHTFIEEQVFLRAGMRHSGFFRSDSLPKNTALGYLIGKGEFETNILNLPVIGSGDGGAYSNLEDIRLFWESLLSFEIVNSHSLKPMVAVQNQIDDACYGLGFWIDEKNNFIALEGYDAGISFYSATTRDQRTMFTVISNDRSGAWPVLGSIKKELFQPAAGGDAAR